MLGLTKEKMISATVNCTLSELGLVKHQLPLAIPMDERIRKSNFETKAQTQKLTERNQKHASKSVPGKPENCMKGYPLWHEVVGVQRRKLCIITKIWSISYNVFRPLFFKVFIKALIFIKIESERVGSLLYIAFKYFALKF